MKIADRKKFWVGRKKSYMLLYEAGYDKKDHDAGVNALKHKGLTISQVIEKLVDLYDKLYKVSAYKINCGMCEDFAADVCAIIPDAIFDWGEAFIQPHEDKDKYAYHCIVRYQGKFYDSEHPEGEKDFRGWHGFA